MLPVNKLITMIEHKGLSYIQGLVRGIGILVGVFIHFSSSSSNSGLKNAKGSADYCLLDTFEPHCSEDQVVLIDSAIYGRTKNSRCIQHGAGHVGCFVDVKNIIESSCSGRKTCKVPASHINLLSTRPCGDIQAFLTASYSCIKVLTTRLEQCRTSSKAKVTADNGYLSSDLASNGGPGSRSCPWKLQSKSGKQFNLTIQTFQSNQDGELNSPPVCFEAVIFKERQREKKTLICPSDPKTKQLMISEGNEIEVIFPISSTTESRAFIIQFEATGCPNPTIPQGAYFTRRGHLVEIKCNKTKVSWRLECVDDKWNGEEKECSDGWMLSSVLGTEESLPLGVLVIVVTGIALGVLIGGFLLYLAINAFKRYHGLLPGQQIQNPSYEKPFYNPNNKLAGYNDRTIQRSSMIYGTQRRSYPNRQAQPPVPPPHADNANIRPPSEISECNRQSHIYETPLFNSL